MICRIFHLDLAEKLLKIPYIFWTDLLIFHHPDCYRKHIYTRSLTESFITYKVDLPPKPIKKRRLTSTNLLPPGACSLPSLNRKSI